jgi:hypothetical protein
LIYRDCSNRLYLRALVLSKHSCDRASHRGRT